MTDPVDGETFAGAGGAGQGPPPRPSFTPSRPLSPPSPSPTPTQGPGFSPRHEEPPAHAATESAQPHQARESARSHPSTEAAQPQRPADDDSWARTSTATGGPWSGGSAPVAGRAGSRDAWASTVQRPDGSAEVRYGPGVPGTGSAGQSAPGQSGPGQSAPAGRSTTSAEEVWRTGRLPGPAPRRGHWRRRAGTALTAVLLVACGVVIYLRLHHAPLTVTGVAITAQVKNGCAVDVTGRISTSGGAGTVSYQWVFTPQVTAPQPLSQSVTAGQTAVYVTVSDQGTGHGQLAQQVTLQVLGPEQGSASAHVVLSC